MNKYDVEEARWDLYWRAYKDIKRVDEHPNDRNTPERQEDFWNWLEKVLTQPDWFIAPGVTAEDRTGAQLPLRTISTEG